MLKDVTFVLSKFVVFDLIKTALFLSYPEARDSLSASLLVSLVSGSLAGMVSLLVSTGINYWYPYLYTTYLYSSLAAPSLEW
jgi:hypothetical protein